MHQQRVTRAAGAATVIADATLTPVAPVVTLGGPLSPGDLWRVAHRAAPVDVSPAALACVTSNRAAFEQAVSDGAEVYGLTTGVGALVTHAAATTNPRNAGRALLRSHAAGVGTELARTSVRAAMVARLAALARGHSGIRPGLLQAIALLLNADLIPCVPAGSLGPTGELAAAAHTYLPLIGEGQVRDAAGRMLSGERALAAVGLGPLQLDGREALALLSGTSFPAGIAGLAVVRIANLVAAADVAAALSFEALEGAMPALDERVHALAHLPGQTRSAANMRAMLAGYAPVASALGPPRLQDPFSLRCAPQIHGAARTAATFFATIAAGELSSVTDNPLTFNAPPAVLSSGNFHGQALAMASDTMRAAAADLAGVSERRTYRLVSPSINGDLPPFLTPHQGASGYMILQYTAAGLVSELRLLAHPVGPDNVVVSDDQEDHASNAMLSVNALMESIDRLEWVIATELICACQGLDMRTAAARRPLARGTRLARDLVRSRVSPLSDDRAPADDLARAATLISSGLMAGLLDDVKASDHGLQTGPQ